MLDKRTIGANIINAVANTKATTPLAGSITNYVTIDFVANAQLASGGSAAMVYLPDEAVALATASKAFYINLGTLLPSHEEAMCKVADALSQQHKPWVLDPVAIGLGAEHTRILQHMKTSKPSIIRCNASEAIALAELWDLDTNNAAGINAAPPSTSDVTNDSIDTASSNTDASVNTSSTPTDSISTLSDADPVGAASTDATETSPKGVDSTASVDTARNAAIALARFINGAVAVSGEADLVTDGSMLAFSHGGTPLMGKVTGFGCSLGGVVAAYAACTDPFTAALAGTNAYNFAADHALPASHGPASFKVAFLDALYNATPNDIANNPFDLEEL